MCLLRFILPLLLFACTGDKVSSADPIDTGDTGATALDCEDSLTRAPEWFDREALSSWPGSLEFGQTHVTMASEDRYGPPVVAERETLLLFTPDSPTPTTTDVRVSAWDGDTLLGTLAMQDPESIPGILEQGLTEESLAPYSTEAWSATLPWEWVREGVELQIGTPEDAGMTVAGHIFEDLGAPQRFTVTRSKIVLFGDETVDTSTRPAEQITQDFYGSLPVAELRWVDSTDWVLDEFVVSTDEGYRMVSSEDERLSVTNESSRWSLIKHQFSLRMSAANTGRGLVLNDGWEGDSSPYSFGTSLVMGWVVDEDGHASDIDDAGVAAGWTGWTAMWVEECGNTFIHEVGHSCTLNHFTSGTASSWGISDQYPNDGQNMSDHPWGYDSSRRQFRTWYQVSSDGPVEGPDEGKSGKYDPMNGGEAANALSCFPQYTAYHGAVIQKWSEDSPTLAEIDGEAGAWIWNAYDTRYERYDVDSAHQEPLQIDVPVVSLIGTIGGLEEATQQTYPPLYSISGNVFELPDPEDAELDSEFEGAQWFLEIHYADGSLERALIAVGEVAETDLKVYALNLSSEREPVAVDLFYSDSPWPEIDVEGSELVHSRDIAVPAPDELPPVVTSGRGQLASGSLSLSERCTPGLDCDTRDATSSWRQAGGALTFGAPDGGLDETADCLAHDDFSVLTVPVVDDEGGAAELIVHAQRLVEAGATTIAVPLNDRTPWMDTADLTQSIRVWIPYEENAGLSEGHYRVYGDYVLEARLDEETVAEVPLVVDLSVYEAIDAPLEEGYWAGPVSQDDSSVYFIVTDSAMGPDYGVWWDDWVDGPPTLSVPVLDVDTGEATTLYVDAYKTACDAWWDLHSAQGYENGACDNYAALYMSEDNDHLQSGHSYRSPGSSLLIVEAYRWHSPDPYTLLERYPLRVSYTAP